MLFYRAANEMSIRETFNELDSFAASTTLSTYSHLTAQGDSIKLIKNWRIVLNQVSESILTLQSVKNAEIFQESSDFAERASIWESRLDKLDKILALLNSVQRKWIFLEPIYSKDDTGMLNDYSFAPASNDYIDIMKSISTDPHVIRLIHINGLENRLNNIDQTLIACQKKLQQFMEESRARFPRFYFLADDDLLLILAGKAQVNQAGLLKKLFNNSIVKLHFDEKFIKSAESPEGELITLKEKVYVDTDKGASGVEQWLRQFEQQLKNTLKQIFFDAIIQFNRKSQWNQMLNLPSQILSIVQWVLFTENIENSIRTYNYDDVKSQYQNQLYSLTNYQNDSSFDGIINIKIKSLVLDTIHFLSVITQLASHSVKDINEWIWQKQLRFYSMTVNRDKKLLIKMGNSSFEYSFEYLGCFGGAKLVHTPLTDKCYLTLTQGKGL